MKTYLVARREELKKRQNKGFTLMEMLIVVAIIAVLIAIAIPVFTSQLEKSRESTDAANIRSAYGVIQAAVLTQDAETELKKNDNNETTYTVTGSEGSRVYTATIKLVQEQEGWQNDTIKDIAGTPTSSLTGVGKGKSVTVTHNQTNGTTVIAVAS